MNNLNSVLIEGNLATDPTCETMKDGRSNCAFCVVSQRSHKEEEKVVQETGTFAVEAFGRLADVCGEYLKAGRGVRVMGRLRQSGTAIIIVAEHVEFKPAIKK
jgi:single-strand DNA-binding protein